VASLVTTKDELASFQTAVSALVVQPKRVTLPRPCGQKEYEIVSFDNFNGAWRVSGQEKNTSPSDVFFRTFPNRPFRAAMTTRLAQNDDGKLFFRETDLGAVGRFLDLMFANRIAPPKPALPLGPGDQTFFFAIEADADKVFKAVLKTGVNLVAHFYGAEAVHDPAFDPVRHILLENNTSGMATKRCALAPEVTADFPRLRVETHQLMLDSNEGRLRFRMRLYNSFSYTCDLAELTASLSARMARTLPKRVVVEFQGAGIREATPDWR